MSHESVGSALRKTIEDFAFDEGTPALSFARRLARENGWTLAHAERVLREYKRFVWLAVAAGHPVTPSEAVDQAWHLHLTYTRSYWHRFCRETLSRPLHHEPTRGGPDEAAKHERQYAETLASYERHFGEAPPRDIWPEMEFTTAADRWVDTSRYWLIPKPRLPRSSRSLVAAAIVLPVAAAWNPFDFDGPTFLAFFAVIAIAALVTGLLLRFLASDGSDERSLCEVTDPYEAAYLANSTPGMIQAVLTTLVRRGNLLLERGELSRGEPLPADAPSVEKVFFNSMPRTGTLSARELKNAVQTIKPHVAEARERLRSDGLVTPHPDEPFTKRWLPALLMFGVAVLGAGKIAVGLSRDKPVMFLVFLTIAAFMAAGLFLGRGRLTDRGQAVTDALKKEHRLLTSGRVDAMSPLEAAMLVGLFGSVYLAGSELSVFHDMRQHWAASSASGCGTSGCGGGGGCGGGCGGCGGCG